jgi:glycosyltransferase involved in cell wall biosynthesis
MAPAISVAVPLFNKEDYISAALSSVRRQSFADYEIVVVDDGSTDNGGSIVKSLNLPNLRLVHQPNAGVSAARNRCLAEASAEYVAFLDADDVWSPDHLKHLWALHLAQPDACLRANAFIESDAPSGKIDSTDVQYRAVPDFIAEASSGKAWVFTSAAMVHRDSCVAAGGFEVGENRGEDIDLWIRMALRFTVAVSDYIGAFYRRMPNSLTSSVVLEPDVAMRRIERLLGDRSAGSGDTRGLVELYNRLALAHAGDCLMNGKKEAAAKFLALAANTQEQRPRWALLNVMRMLPTSIVRVAWRVRGWLR